MEEIIAGFTLLVISILAFIVSIFSFMEKGFLFNNAYIYSSKEERKNMNKKPYYKQSAIVFIFLGLIFLLNSLSLFFKWDWILYVVLPIVFIVIIFAVVSSIKISKNNKDNNNY